MENTFGIIFLAVVDNRPQIMNLKELLEHFILHRKEVVVRRTRFLLRKSEERAHILEGLKIARTNPAVMSEFNLPLDAQGVVVIDPAPMIELTRTPVVPTGPLADMKPDVPLNPPDPASLDEWTATALENNPGIISAKYNVDIARKEIDRQDAADSPAVDLVGSYSFARSDADAGVNSNNGVLGVQLSLPLYTGGGVQAATRQARFQYDAAQDVLEQTRRAVQAQVRNGYRGVLATISRVRALEATQVSAKSALEATEAGFEVGTRTLVDVLNSQRELFRAKQQVAVSRYTYLLNILAVLQAAGTLSVENVQAANAWMQ